MGGEATDAPSSSSDDETLVSIVVPTYNRSSMLAGALETLANQKLDPGLSSEIVVVDNASTDETRDVVEEIRVAHPAARIRYVYEARQGQAFALNRGAAEARGDWIAIFDDDQLAPASWLLELWNTARQRDAAIVGGPIHLHLNEKELAGLDPVCRGALRELHSYDEIHAYDGDRYPAGGNVLIALRIFNRLGGYDTDLSRGSYDLDFFIRARSAGVSMWYTPSGGIRHLVPPYRLEPEYFRWDALRTGDNLAFSDFQYRGRARMLVLGIARLGQAALINGPLWILARARGDASGALGRRILIWRCEGYVRRALALTAPRLLPQSQFFESMEFRKGREIEESLNEMRVSQESSK